MCQVSWLYFIKPVADLDSSKCVCRVSLVGSKNALYFATMIPLLFWAFARNQSRLLSKQVDLSLFTHGRGTTSTFVLAVCPASCTGKDTPLKCFSLLHSATIVDTSVQQNKNIKVIKKIDNIFAGKKKLEVSLNAIYLLLHPIGLGLLRDPVESTYFFFFLMRYFLFNPIPIDGLESKNKRTLWTDIETYFSTYYGIVVHTWRVFY